MKLLHTYFFLDKEEFEALQTVASMKRGWKEHGLSLTIPLHNIVAFWILQ